MIQWLKQISTVTHFSFQHTNDLSFKKDDILVFYLEIAHEFLLFNIVENICSYVIYIQKE